MAALRPRSTLADGVACAFPVAWIAVARLFAQDFTGVSVLLPRPDTRHAHRFAVGSAATRVRTAEVYQIQNARVSWNS